VFFPIRPPIVKHPIFAIFAVTLMRHLNHNTGGTSVFRDVNRAGCEATDKNEASSFDMQRALTRVAHETNRVTTSNLGVRN